MRINFEAQIDVDTDDLSPLLDELVTAIESSALEEACAENMSDSDWNRLRDAMAAALYDYLFDCLTVGVVDYNVDKE